jgi:outer membrane receptor protein involved in Fe transport
VNELFGDVVLISANPELRPEKSHNINLGMIWSYQINSTLRINTFYRDISDIIFLGFPIHGARYTNVFDTRSYGAEIEGISRIKDFLIINYALTYQELRNMSNYNYDGTESTKYYNTRLPNTPWLYGNLGFQLKGTDLIGKETESLLSLHTFYVQEYYLRPEPDGGGDSKYVIPTQFYQNLGLSHQLMKNNLTFGIEIQNIFNQKLYDNFRVQKPGRTFQLLMRYKIN